MKKGYIISLAAVLLAGVAGLIAAVLDNTYLHLIEAPLLIIAAIGAITTYLKDND